MLESVCNILKYSYSAKIYSTHCYILSLCMYGLYIDIKSAGWIDR